MALRIEGRKKKDGGKNRVYGNRGNKCEQVGGMGVSALGMVLGLGNHVYGCGIS